MLTQQQRSNKASEIIEAMRTAYEEEGEEGDFDDGYRYLSQDASDAELEFEHDKWVKKVS
jgi:hypothetical protein